MKTIVEVCMTGAFKSMLADVSFKVDIDVRETWAEKVSELKDNAA